MRTKCWSDERYQIETITVRYAARLRNQHHLLLFAIYNILDWSVYESVCISAINIRVDSFFLFQSQIWSKGNNRVSWPGCTGGRRHFLRMRCRGGDFIVEAYIIKDSFARLVDSNVVSYSDVADNFYYQILELMHFC